MLVIGDTTGKTRMRLKLPWQPLVKGCGRHKRSMVNWEQQTRSCFRKMFKKTTHRRHCFGRLSDRRDRQVRENKRLLVNQVKQRQWVAFELLWVKEGSLVISKGMFQIVAIMRKYQYNTLSDSANCFHSELSSSVPCFKLARTFILVSRTWLTKWCSYERKTIINAAENYKAETQPHQNKSYMPGAWTYYFLWT